MAPVCMFEILELPEEDLKRILPKASSRSLVRLVAAYPRTVGRLFIQLLTCCVSPATMQFLREEMDKAHSPTFPQIREAECELLKIIERDQIFLAPLAA